MGISGLLMLYIILSILVIVLGISRRIMKIALVGAFMLFLGALAMCVLSFLIVSM